MIRDSLVGIDERSTFNAKCAMLEIYSNPARNYFAIRLPQSADHLTLKIYDVCGKLVKEITCNQKETETKVSLNGINLGIYFVKVGDAPTIKKLVVTK